MDERVRRAAGRRSLAVIIATAAAACAAAGVPAAFAGGDEHPPGGDRHPRGGDAQSPGVDVRSPGVDVRSPGVDVRSPGVDVRWPGVDVRSPRLKARSPKADARNPGGGAHTPRSGAHTPGGKRPGAKHALPGRPRLSGGKRRPPVHRGSPGRGEGSPRDGGGRRPDTRRGARPGGRWREGGRRRAPSAPARGAPAREGARIPGAPLPGARVPALAPPADVGAPGAPQLRVPSAPGAEQPSDEGGAHPSPGQGGQQPSGGEGGQEPWGGEGGQQPSYGQQPSGGRTPSRSGGGKSLRERSGGGSGQLGNVLTAALPRSGPAGFAGLGAAPVGAATPGAAAGTGVAPLAATPPSGAPGGGARTREEKGRARSPERPEKGGVPHKVGRALTKAVEVVPESIKAILGALAAISVILLGAWAFTATRARRLARQRRALLKDVGALQGALLPAVPARVGALAVSAAYRPADGPVAGGDFYDVFALPGGSVGMMVGDLSGHGRDALAPTAFLRYTLRAHMEAGTGLRETLKLTEEAFERAPMVNGPNGAAAAEGLPRSRRFATVMLALYDPAARTLTYAGAGHPPPIVVAPDAGPPVTACSAPPLGLAMETGTRETTLSLPRGAAACLYTNGLPEARSSGRMLGDERLAELVRELGPDDRAEKLVDRVTEEADTVPDDLAVCLVRPVRGGAEGGRPVRVEQLEVGPGEADAAGRFLDACDVPREQSAAALGRIAATLARGRRALLRVDLSGERPEVDALAVEQVA